MLEGSLQLRSSCASPATARTFCGALGATGLTVMEYGCEPLQPLLSTTVTVALNVQAHAFSASAKEKIAAAGGAVTEL